MQETAMEQVKAVVEPDFSLQLCTFHGWSALYVFPPTPLHRSNQYR